MAVLRCGACDLCFPPPPGGRETCDVCGGPLVYGAMTLPENWEQLVGNACAVYTATAGLTRDDGAVAWRFDQLVQAGFSFEQADALARGQVDLHRAAELLGRAGADLAFTILS